MGYVLDFNCVCLKRITFSHFDVFAIVIKTFLDGFYRCENVNAKMGYVLDFNCVCLKRITFSHLDVFASENVHICFNLSTNVKRHPCYLISGMLQLSLTDLSQFINMPCLLW